MPEKFRYNKVIELLENDKTVFCSGLVWNGNLDDLTFVADSAYDMVIIEMEHPNERKMGTPARLNWGRARVPINAVKYLSKNYSVFFGCGRIV